MDDEPAHYRELGAVEDAAWAILERGVGDRGRPAHTPVLATVAADGRPEARTVVLRGASRRDRTLTFHTDARSAKCAALARDPRATLHVYEPDRKVQLRVSCTVTLHRDDALADERWQATPALSRRNYQTAESPGSAVADPAELRFEDAGVDAGREHFVVAVARVTSVEWLYLALQGHRRARVGYTEDGTETTWLVP